MKVTVTVEFEGPDAMAQAAQYLLGQPAAVVVGVQAPTAEPPKKRGRKARPEDAAAPKTEDPHETRVITPEEIAAAKEAVISVTKEDAQAALKKMFAAKGMTAARELLQRHGVERLKDLKPEQYPAFVGAAQEALK